jgi:hypothetical protein
LLRKVIRKISIEEEMYELNKQNYVSRGTLVEIHSSDWHFGAFDAKTQYTILEEQLFSKIENVPFDIFSIDGDIFEVKEMANSDSIMYAIKAVDRVVNICRNKNATFIILYGTESHDADQLKLFYHYLEDKSVDIRIIEKAKFEYVKGAKILILPEEYGKGEDYYNNLLKYSGYYDSVFMHGTMKGSVMGADKEDLNNPKAPVFDINSFCNCGGPIVAGHVHKPGCFNTYFYYCGTPYRYKYGEEEEKGFIILLHNLDSREHYAHFEPIKSFRYDTINLDHMLSLDPKEVIGYLNQLQLDGIDNIRVEFTIGSDNINILKHYYRNNPNIKIKDDSDKANNQLKVQQEALEQFKEYEFVLDKSLNEYQKLTQYINYHKGYEYITVEELIKILEDV